MVRTPCNVLGTILNVDIEGSQIDQQKDNEAGDYAQGLTFEIWQSMFWVIMFTKEGRRGLGSCEDCINVSEQGVEDLIERKKKD